MRDDGDKKRDRDNAEILAHTLDALEAIIRDALADQRTARSWRRIDGWDINLRGLDLTAALAAVATARAELARCPDGAGLALAVQAATLDRVRLDVEYAKTRYQGARKGAKAPKRRRRRRTARQHAKLRATAKTLRPKSATAKAKILAKNSKLSESRIRHIIAK